MEREKPIYRPSIPGEPLRQGEILSDLIQAVIDLDSIDTDEKIINHITHAYAIIASQDCDLDWDYKARQGKTEAYKKIPNILFCEVVTAEELRGRADINSRTWRRIGINKDERYHFFQKVEPAQDSLTSGLPELGVDFKRYFTIPTDEVYARIEKGETKRRCCLISPYLEHFSTRFYYFQSRIALPEEHFSEPNVSQG